MDYRKKGINFYINNLDFTENCRIFRQLKGYLQVQVAEDTGYTQRTISRFESGRLNNAIIYNWYISHGFKPYYDYRGILNEEIYSKRITKYRF